MKKKFHFLPPISIHSAIAQLALPLTIASATFYFSYPARHSPLRGIYEQIMFTVSSVTVSSTNTVKVQILQGSRQNAGTFNRIQQKGSRTA
jgi:ABC-type transport system involved in cytochrome c biogenesis permease subunit